jgi:EAL domain-containing protein (putative c-di-GMP-specific phosphodiesterase class I)
VETSGQHHFLADHGCHLFQGYLFGKPVPAEALDLGDIETRFDSSAGGLSRW